MRMGRWIGSMALLAAAAAFLAWPSGRGVAVAADTSTDSLRARVVQLEATELALRQELARERATTAALRAEKEQLAAQLAAARAEIDRLKGNTGSPAPAPAAGSPQRAGPLVIRLQVGRPEIQVNDTWYTSDVPPISVDGRVMLPVRAVAETAGFEVGWDSNTGTVTLTAR